MDRWGTSFLVDDEVIILHFCNINIKLQKYNNFPFFIIPFRLIKAIA